MNTSSSSTGTQTQPRTSTPSVPVPVAPARLARPASPLDAFVRWFRNLRQSLMDSLPWRRSRVAPAPGQASVATPSNPLKPPSALALNARQTALSEFDTRIGRLEHAGGGLVQRLEALHQIEQGVNADARLDDAARSGLTQRLQTLRKAIEPTEETLRASVKEALAEMSWDRLGEALEKRGQALADVTSMMAHSRGLTDDARKKLSADVQEARGTLAAWQGRGATLQALKETDKAPALAGALAGLDPRAYLKAQASLRTIAERLPGTPRATLMGRLDEWIRHKDQADWLNDIAAGHVGIIDMVFKGADWHEDALALKLAAVATDDRQALLNLDVQHNLRMVADELDGFMASRNAAGAQWQLPISLFGAVKANQAVVDWLVKYASKEVGARTAQIAAWISLSLYDPHTGMVNQAEVDELVAKLHEGGIDAALLKEHIRQGFRNTAEVVECRELMQSVARACQESTLLASLDEERFHAVRASRVVCDLFREVTGKETELASGAEVDQALAEAVDKALPWVRFEQDLSLAQAELQRELLDLSQASFTVAGHADADRSWIARPKELEAAARDHDRVRDILFADARIKELQANKGDPNRIAELAASIATQCRQLAGFSPAQLRRIPGSLREPTLSELRGLQLEMDRLARLPVLHRRVEALQARAIPDARQAGSIKPLLERLRQIATLQVALESGDPAFRPNGTPADGTGSYTGQIIKRLAAFGISMDRQSAFLRNECKSAAEAIGKDDRPVEKLLKDLDPQATGNRVRVALGLGKRGSLSAPAASGAAQATASVTEGQRRQAIALASVERQVRGLSLGQAFDIRMGVYGTVSVGTPIIPGLSASTDVRAERQGGLRVTLAPDGAYLVDVQGGGSVRHGVSLSALSDLVNVRGESQVERERGFELRFGDRDTCLSMLRSLITGAEVDPAAWAPEHVQRVERQSVTGRASLTAKADLTIAALSVEAAAAFGSESTFMRSSAGEVETQLRRVAASATASAQAAAGDMAREVSAGSSLAASKRLVRQYGMLRPGSEATMSASVIGGNAASCLDQLLPKEAGLSDAQRAAILATLPQEQGQVPDGTELFVRYQLKSEAIREANALLGRASQALTRAALADGEARLRARAEAGDFARQAHAVTRRAENYALEGWGWTRRNQAEVSHHRGAYQQFARGESAQTRFMPAAADTGIAGLCVPASLALLLP